jgi:F-type H+-transporting ATPase subunit b
MRPLLVPALLLGLAAVPRVMAQEKAATGETKSEEGNLGPWKWANFLLLAGGLGYLAGKHGGPFFAARSKSIRKDMIEAAETRQDAETRAAAVERRIANLESEIAALRAEAQREEQSETERIAQHSAAEMAKLQAHAEQEIASAAKAARMDLKRYSADLAIQLAEQKIRARLTPDGQDALVRGFVRDLEPSASRPETK